VLAVVVKTWLYNMMVKHSFGARSSTHVASCALVTSLPLPRRDATVTFGHAGAILRSNFARACARMKAMLGAVQAWNMIGKRGRQILGREC